MKKKLITSAIALCFSIPVMTNAATLMQVFQQSLGSDPTYQQAISQRLSTREGVPISIAGLLPSLSAAVAAPSYSRTTYSGSATLGYPDDQTQNGYNVTLNLSQTVFDFGKYAGVASANELSKGADATLNAATQSLMIRVATAYFNILRDQDNLIYIKATRTAFGKQLDQIKQQYKVGLKTITDVYTARASYEESVASTIAAENTLATDRENLRAITGVLYPSISILREDFPLISPNPDSIDDWVTTAGRQNWSVKSAQFSAASARDVIKQEFAGHLPTVNVAASYQDTYYRAGGGNAVLDQNGSFRSNNLAASLNFNIPLVEGGLVIAQTNQAKYNYQVALQELEFQLRSTLTLTRQSYLNVEAGISKVAADRQSIKSNISSLQGMQAGYKVGTEILVNVLNQQQSVFQAQEQYASDRYAYVINLLTLKQAAGTLSVDDLRAINAWLSASNRYNQAPLENEGDNPNDWDTTKNTVSPKMGLPVTKKLAVNHAVKHVPVVKKQAYGSNEIKLNHALKKHLYTQNTAKTNHVVVKKHVYGKNTNRTVASVKKNNHHPHKQA